MKPPKFKFRNLQSGVILLLIVLSLLAIGGTIFLAAIADSQQSERGKAVATAKFNDATDLRQAIFGYILSAPIGGAYLRPGSLPVPDSLFTPTYDGLSETKCLGNNAGGNGLPAANNNTAAQRCLGRWPWQVVPIDLSGASRDSTGALMANDPNGAIPWIAISANLSLQDTCLTKLNSDVLHLTYTAFLCTAPLPHPWLTVVGSNGEVLTNRAAVVIIIPGPSQKLDNGYVQTRASNAAPGNPKDYLDRISLPLGCSASCTATYDNAGLDNTFIQFPTSAKYPANSEDASKTGYVPFNDIVVYITIDDLMPVIEKRVLAEMKASLTSFASTAATPSGTLGWPWAASYALPANDGAFISNAGTIVGMFPFFPVSPSTTPTGYSTAVNWSSSAVRTAPSNLRVCRRVRTGPARWVNVAQGVTTEASALSGSIPTATARWRGATAVELNGTSTTPTIITKAFASWYSTSADCTDDVDPIASPPTYTVSRTVTLNLSEPTCASPTATYANGTSTLPHRIDWTCPMLTTPTLDFPITINDTITDAPLSPVSASYPVYPGNSASVTLNNMRYQPLMASWFYDNEWYKQSFYAVANSSAPASTTNCSSATTLTVGSTTGVQALVMLSGKSLTNAVRPSLPAGDYLELKNSTSSIDCLFEDKTRALASTYNDQTVVVSP
jgi:hypothetical protein